MQAIQNAVRRFLIVANLSVVKNALLRLCRKQPQPIQQTEPVAVSATKGTVKVEEDDAEDKFAAWEDDRDEKLHQAEEFEQQGLSLLAKAALLRVAIRCDDRGETFLAEELREHAQKLESETVQSLSTEERWAPIVRFAPTNAASTPRGA